MLVLMVILSLVTPVISLLKPGFSYKGHPGMVKRREKMILFTNRFSVVETRYFDGRRQYYNPHLLHNNVHKFYQRRAVLVVQASDFIRRSASSACDALFSDIWVVV